MRVVVVSEREAEVGACRHGAHCRDVAMLQRVRQAVLACNMKSHVVLACAHALLVGIFSSRFTAGLQELVQRVHTWISNLLRGHLMAHTRSMIRWAWASSLYMGSCVREWGVGSQALDQFFFSCTLRDESVSFKEVVILQENDGNHLACQLRPIIETSSILKTN